MIAMQHCLLLRSLRPAAFGVVLMGIGCGGPGPAAPPAGGPPAQQQLPEPAADDLFEDATAESGLRFVHFTGRTGEYYFHEMMGAGAALLDYDRDGDLDVYLVQGHLLGPGKTMADALDPAPGEPPFLDRLFRNDLEVLADGSRRLTFVDVTAESGIAADGYGMGAAVGDFDNDGWPDLYVTNYGFNQLWRNRGNGTFVDVTAKAGADDTRWSVPAVFFDYDRDGWLDLFIGNYVDFSIAAHQRCTTELGGPNYCGPLAYEPQGDRLLRNRGDGTFEDVTGRAGLAGAAGGALGALAGDFDGDGWPDLYVGNDGLPNFLWRNRGDGTFADDGLLSGTAVNAAGQPEASMGVTAGDFDGDGDEDLFMAHLTQETNTLYRNDGGLFADVSVASGLASPSLEFTGFGTSFFDYDNDGRLDLLVVNGAVKVIEELALAADPFPLHQRNLLFHNDGGGRFGEVSRQGGPAFARSEVSRGAAFGDLDNDGETDVVVTQSGGPARLLLNRRGQERAWLGLSLVDGGRLPPGTMAEVSIGGRTLRRWARTAGSYGSASDPRLLFGFGDGAAGEVEVRVEWPDDNGARREVFSGVATGRYTTLDRGRGLPWEP